MRRNTTRVVIGIACSSVAAWCFLHFTRAQNPQYAEFLHAKRLADFIGRHIGSRLLSAIPLSPRLRLASHFALKAEVKKIKLYRSGVLASLTLYAPDLPERRAWLTRPQIEAINGRQFIEVRSSDEDTIDLVCLPQNVAELQSRFCYITNYVPRGPLARLAGFNSEDAEYRLPDGTTADLVAVQRWLNQSTAAGWRVGVSWVSQQRGTNGLLVIRQRPKP